MARNQFTSLPPRIEAEVQERAIRNMRLAFRRAIKRGAMPRWAERGDHKAAFLRIYRKSAIKNYFRAKQGRTDFFQVDHIVPLAGENVCGLMVPWNLHVIPSIVNNAKSTIIVEEWHNKMPDDGRKQLRAAQEKNSRISEGYLRRRRLRESARMNTTLDILFK